jgi:4-amino-4-deoxy-L-arabinose transferase-like glycosyltransferase
VKLFSFIERHPLKFIDRGNVTWAQAPFHQPFGLLDTTDIRIAVGLTLATAIILIPGLGVQSLATWDEAIYGVVTRDLLARPRLTLYYGLTPWFEKPPFLFWLMAGSALTFGVTEFALRLPIAIFGIGAVVLQYFAGRRLGGRVAGIMAAVLLLGVPQFVAYSRLAMTDVPLAALGMLSIVLIVYGANQRALTVAAGAAFGLAILTKSVAAFVFLPGLLAIIVAQRGVASLWSREILLAVAVALGIALPWHIWSVITYGRSFIDQYLVFHVLDRFARPLEGHEGGPFYYFSTYAYNAGWFALVHAVGLAIAVALAVLQRDRLLAAVVLLALGAFAIVNAQGTKIGWYLTPVYPGVALAAALGITRFLRSPTAQVTAVLVALVLAAPGIIDGRGSFVERYDILDYSPEIRALRKVPRFAKTRIPVLYTMGVSDPALRFYLADQVESIDEVKLERLLAANRHFLCLTFKPTAMEFLSKPAYPSIQIVASTKSLAVIGRW